MFFLNTSLNLLPGKRASPVSKIWKITPMLNMSQTTEYLDSLFMRLAISGATKPGVPHFGKIKGKSFSKVASPKSAIYNLFKEFLVLNSRFSGFISRCIICYLAKY